jgi:hypothetical protein
VPVEVVSKFLGHSSIRMTVDIYGHIGDAQTRTAADAMDVALGGFMVPGPRTPQGSPVSVDAPGNVSNRPSNVGSEGRESS